jgi:hypothetical protein
MNISTLWVVVACVWAWAGALSDAGASPCAVLLILFRSGIALHIYFESVGRKY